MPSYRFDVSCRERGALGVTEPRVLTAEGETVDDALVSLYDRWEHVRVFDAVELPATSASGSAGGEHA
jgi:hypothetical protein